MSYHSGARYTTLIKELSESKQWAMLQLLEGKDHDAQLEEMRRLFLVAVGQRDDEQARSYFRWLMRAVDDTHLADFLETKGKWTVFKRDDGLTEANENRCRCRAAEAMRLWSRVPEKGVGKRRVQVTENESYLEDCDAPTLLETKKAVLEEVTRRWRETKDEDEADSMFDLIVGVGSRFEVEHKMLETVVREATGHGFPSIRLMRCYLRIAGKMERYGCGLQNRIAQMLAIGWARNSNPDDLAQIFSAVQPLLKEKRDPAYPEFACLRETAD